MFCFVLFLKPGTRRVSMTPRIEQNRNIVVKIWYWKHLNYVNIAKIFWSSHEAGFQTYRCRSISSAWNWCVMFGLFFKAIKKKNPRTILDSQVMWRYQSKRSSREISRYKSIPWIMTHALTTGQLKGLQIAVVLGWNVLTKFNKLQIFSDNCADLGQNCHHQCGKLLSVFAFYLTFLP